jgi:hypothetical protein
MANIFCDFIPIPSGQFNFLQSQPLISDLLGQVGYEVRGKEVYFTKDLTTQSPKIENVDVQLIVMDFTQFTDSELIPIDADTEAKVIEAVVAQFLPTSQPRPQTIDPTSDTK